MTRSLAALLGVLLFIALTVFCVTRHAPRIAERLAASTSTSLSEGGIDWADVHLEGRSATLTGVAPSLAERERAIRLVSSVGGIGGVVDRLDVLPPVFEFIAERRGDKVILTGNIPKDGSKAAVIGRAATLFGADAVVDRIQESGPAPDDSWVNMARRGIDLIVSLDSGRVRLRNRDVSLSGVALSAQEQQRLSFELLEELPSGYTSRLDISVPAPGVLTSEGCSTKVRELMQAGGIAFETDSARLRPESSPVLNEVVALVKRCPASRIEVRGHTDSLGDAALNVTLSRQRALAVADYLIGRGVDARRIAARGLGETRPIATNRTQRGRAMNRRIEFEIAGGAQ
jgi:OOP family OmpA-OmpF porin